MKIGIILPRSTFYSTLNIDIIAGIRSYLESQDLNDVEICMENVGFGTDKQQVYRAAEQLILNHDVQLIFAYLGHDTAQVIRPLLAATNRLMIILDPGANLPHEWPVSEFIYYLSLNNALGCALASDMAVKENGQSVAITTNFYDGGYLQTMAAAIGVHSAGGRVDFNLATGFRREEFSLETISNWENNNGKNPIIAIFSMDYMQWFNEEAKRYITNKQTPIYVPPLSVEEDMLEQAEYVDCQFVGLAAWSRLLQNPSNQHFCETMIKAQQKSANLFNLLGWEAGMMIQQFKENGATKNGRENADLLKQMSFDTPRGKLHFYEGVNYSMSPLYKVKMVKNENGKCALEVLETIDGGAMMKKMIDAPLDNVVSGWKNSYLCN